MGCNNTNGIINGLLGDCGEINIGCLTVTAGEPTENPLSDQLPIRIDPNTGSLWVWHCNEVQDSGTWLELPHTTLCSATALNPSAIDDVCDKLQIPVAFTETGQPCEERLVEIVDLATQLKECIDLRRVCELDSLSDAQVGIAGSVQLAACVDENEVLISPTSALMLCSLPTMTNNDLFLADDVFTAGCVDDVNVKFERFSICQLPFEPAANIEPTDTVRIAACINSGDGDNQVLIDPYSLCDLNVLTQANVGAATTVMLAACVDDEESLIPNVLPTQGVWVPTIEGATTAGTFNYSQQDGDFTILGNRVLFSLHIVGNWSVAPVGDMRVTIPTPLAISTSTVVTDIKHIDVSPNSDLIALGTGLQNYLTLNIYGVNGGTTAVAGADQVSVINEIIMQGSYIKAP